MASTVVVRVTGAVERTLANMRSAMVRRIAVIGTVYSVLRDKYFVEVRAYR